MDVDKAEDLRLTKEANSLIDNYKSQELNIEGNILEQITKDGAVDLTEYFNQKLDRFNKFIDTVHESKREDTRRALSDFINNSDVRVRKHNNNLANIDFEIEIDEEIDNFTRASYPNLESLEDSSEELRSRIEASNLDFKTKKLKLRNLEDNTQSSRAGVAMRLFTGELDVFSTEDISSQFSKVLKESGVTDQEISDKATGRIQSRISQIYKLRISDIEKEQRVLLEGNRDPNSVTEIPIESFKIAYGEVEGALKHTEYIRDRQSSIDANNGRSLMGTSSNDVEAMDAQLNLLKNELQNPDSTSDPRMVEDRIKNIEAYKKRFLERLKSSARDVAQESVEWQELENVRRQAEEDGDVVVRSRVIALQDSIVLGIQRKNNIPATDWELINDDEMEQFTKTLNDFFLTPDGAENLFNQWRIKFIDHKAHGSVLLTQAVKSGLNPKIASVLSLDNGSDALSPILVQALQAATTEGARDKLTDTQISELKQKFNNHRYSKFLDGHNGLFEPSRIFLSEGKTTLVSNELQDVFIDLAASQFENADALLENLFDSTMILVDVEHGGDPTAYGANDKVVTIPVPRRITVPFSDGTSMSIDVDEDLVRGVIFPGLKQIINNVDGSRVALSNPLTSIRNEISRLENIKKSGNFSTFQPLGVNTSEPPISRPGTTAIRRGDGVTRLRTNLTPEEESEFQKWYKSTAERIGINSDPDNIEQKYDYRGFWKSGDTPTLDPKDNKFHFSSTFKDPDHSTRIQRVEGVLTDTITGEPVPEGTIDQSSVEANLDIQLRQLRRAETEAKLAGAEESELLDMKELLKVLPSHNLLDRYIAAGGSVRDVLDEIGIASNFPIGVESIISEIGESIPIFNPFSPSLRTASTKGATERSAEKVLRSFISSRIRGDEALDEDLEDMDNILLNPNKDLSGVRVGFTNSTEGYSQFFLDNGKSFNVGWASALATGLLLRSKTDASRNAPIKQSHIDFINKYIRDARSQAQEFHLTDNYVIGPDSNVPLHSSRRLADPKVPTSEEEAIDNLREEIRKQIIGGTDLKNKQKFLDNLDTKLQDQIKKLAKVLDPDTLIPDPLFIGRKRE